MKLYKYLSFLVILTIMMGVSMVITTPAQSQTPTLDCSTVGLEQMVALPGDVLRIDGTTPDMTDLAITAVIADTETPVEVLIATERNPIIFVDRPETVTVITETADNADNAEASTTPLTTTGATLSINAANNINVRGGPSTQDDVVGVVVGGTTTEAIGRNDAGDWVLIDIDTDEGTVPGWVFVSLFTYNGDVNNLPVVDPNAPLAPTPTLAPEVTPTDNTIDETPVFNPNAEPPALYLLVPFFPDDILNGGDIALMISAGDTLCDPLSLTIAPLSENPGEFERVVMLTGELLALQRDTMGVTREQLLAVLPTQLDSMLVTLGISQRLFDGPDNPESMMAILERVNNGEFSDEQIRVLDATFGQSNIVDYLEGEIMRLQETLEARRTDVVVQLPVDGSMSASNINNSPITTTMSARQGEFTLQYPEINDSTDLAREMRIATRADYKLNRGASGQVLSDLGVLTATAGLIGNPTNPVSATIGLVGKIGGNLIYIEKSRLEHQAYSGPVRFINFAVRTDIPRFVNENSTRTGNWYVSVVVQSQAWQITKARAYDSGRFWTQGGDLGAADTAAGALDVITAVCDRDGNPCGERQIAFTIPPHTWVVNDMTDHRFFEVSRPSNGEPYAFDFVDDSNDYIPINAGSSGLIITAPREIYGLYRGDGFGNTQVSVESINLSRQSGGDPSRITLAPGETRNLCYGVNVFHQLPEEGRNDFSYEVTNQSGEVVASDEATRDEVICFDIGPVAPSEYDACDLRENREGYIVELISLAENGPRGGTNWNAGTLDPAPKRNHVFSVIAVGEAPDEPDECSREGLWYMVPQTINVVCPSQTLDLPINQVPIPLNADSVNAGLAVFGGVGDVLNVPGAELLPDSVAEDIEESDVVIDNLQTTDDELSPDGRLFTSIPDIAQAGASYVYTFPIDPSGEIEGEVLMNINFDTDDTFDGSMVLQFDIPGLGTCEATVDFTGYFEPTNG